jgi:hypothetical protein
MPDPEFGDAPCRLFAAVCACPPLGRARDSNPRERRPTAAGSRHPQVFGECGGCGGSGGRVDQRRPSSPAIAHEAGLRFALDDIAKVFARTPFITDIRSPRVRYNS